MTTKFDLITFYSEFNKIKDFEESEEKIDRFLETLEKALKIDNKVMFKMFGSFELKETKEREIVDPKDSSNIIHAKPKKYIKFKVSKSLEDNLCLENKEKLSRKKNLKNFMHNRII